MNSNRMKYASTPTYGMQKRNFAKKQAAAQTTPTPDFTQQPAMDPNNPAAPFQAQSTYMMPPGAFPGAVQQTGPMFINQPTSVPPQMIQNSPQQPFIPGSPMNGFNNYMSQQPMPGIPLYQQPLGGAMPQSTGVNFTSRGQGFVPPSYTQGNGAMPPNVIRGDSYGGMNGMNGIPNGIGMGGSNQMHGINNGMPGINGMNNSPNMGGMYGSAGFPNSGLPGNNQNPYGNPGYQQGMMNGSMNMNGYNQPSFPNMEGGAPAMPTPRPPVDVDKWLKIILYGILPVLFIPCIFVSHTFDFLRYLFIIATVISLSVVWYRQSFTSGMRTGISVVYLALSIIVIAMLIGNNKDTQQNNNAFNANGVGQVTPEPTASVEAAPLAAQVSPAPEVDLGESEAEHRLSTFMDYWAVNNVEEMVNLVQPSWASQQDSPAQTLFTVISNRTPTDYQIESISGSASDSSRTVTMSATIDKNNGKDPVRYRFMILMVKESGEWFVDPNSLATNDTVSETTPPVSGKETVAQSLAPRMTVTPVPDPSTKLYYNANGGTYYHIDPNCSAVNPKYLPMASFLYSELDDDPYKSLQPCLKCGAPTQSLAALAAASATPTVAP